MASFACAASLAALPLFLGFFKDELYFTAAAGEGPVVAVLAVGGAALTFAYLGRFWLGLFLGPRRTAANPIPALLVAPVVVLAALSVLGRRAWWLPGWLDRILPRLAVEGGGGPRPSSLDSRDVEPVLTR